jgi:hypothetical protein
VKTTTVLPAIPDSRAPYLSVVVTTRNDDHGGDPLKRLQAFVNCFDEQCKRTGLDAELIVIEWNPPADRPLVSSLLRLPSPSACTYRFIDVPPELHGQLAFADVLPLFQMIAKNVGIRRARGQFILATNIDIILSNELVEFIASRQLQLRRMYRVDRHDILSDFPIDAALEEQMAYCASHQLRVHSRWGSVPVDPQGHPRDMTEDIVDGTEVRLGPGWHVRESAGPGRPFRWASDRAILFLDRSKARPESEDELELDVESNPYDPASWVEVAAVAGDRTLASTRVTGRTCLSLPLGGTDAIEQVELRVSDIAADARSRLPSFERRDLMQYRVYSAKMRTRVTPDRPMFEYPQAHWITANPGSVVVLESAAEGLRVTSDAVKWSYCVGYGVLRAPLSATYRFELTCNMLEGEIGIGVLSASGRSWIPSVTTVRREGSLRHIELVADLRRGAQFILMISNNHPDGEGVSRFTLVRLEGSVESSQLIVNPARTSEDRLDGARAGFEYPVACWTNANAGSAQTFQATSEGLDIASDPRRWSYCAEYGPLRAPRAGTYRFDLTCAVTEGGVSVGVLSGGRKFWIPASVGARTGATCQIAVAVDLPRGAQFRLVVSNNHPQGDGVSRFSILRLEGSVDPARLLVAPKSSVKADSQSERPSFEYPSTNWTRANVDPALTFQATQEGVAISSAPRKWSYCAEYGSLRAPRNATYRFDVTCTVLEGDVSAGVLSGSRRFWFPSLVTVHRDGNARRIEIEVDVHWAAEFHLVVFNDHPDGDAVSRFVLHRLTGSLEPGSMIRSGAVYGGPRLPGSLVERFAILYSRAALRRRTPKASRRAVVDGLTVLYSRAVLLGRGRRSMPSGPLGSIEAVPSLATLISDPFTMAYSRARVFARALSAETTVSGFRQRISKIADGIARMVLAVLGRRMRARLVQAAPEFKALQESLQASDQQLRELAPLREFSGFSTFLRDRRPDNLHTNGCGDFQLMAREHWDELRAYPEFETFSMNIDGLFSYIADAGGVTEQILDMPIYHLEHEIGSGWSPEGEAKLRKRIAESGITWLDATTVYIWAAYMRWLGRPMIFNGHDWGLSSAKLPEHTPSPSSVGS